MNILLTSVGRRTYMVNYFKEALAEKGKVYAANSAETYSMQIADGSVITPLIYDDNYIEFLISYCLQNNIKVVISLFDIDLPILAQNKSKFAEYGIIVIVSEPDFVEVCNDKWLTYNFLLSNGFNTPTTFLSLKDALTAAESRKISFPFIVKPRWGMGSIGIFQADNPDELNILYKKTFNSIYESYLKYESQQAPDNCIIIQEKLVGDEYGLDIFNDLKGNLLSIIGKKKIAMRAGETDSAMIIENSELTRIGKEISILSRHIGNLDIDCFLIGNKCFILEMNCRFGGQYPFSHLAGANFPKAILQMVMKAKVEKSTLYAKEGVVGFKDIKPLILK